MLKLLLPTEVSNTFMEELLLFAGLLILLCTYATLRCISRNVLPAYNYPIQATSQDSCRVITVATPNKTSILQQCTAMNQTETTVKETDTNTLTEIMIGQLKLYK